MERIYKISFCVTCMNRLYHLKKTLMQNFLNNADYPAFELLLLNYNSKDDLENWAHEHFSEFIDKGVFSYYKTEEPTVFSQTHSKNLAFKLADGDIVCNINADNFTGQGFASYVNEVFQENENVFLSPDPEAKIDGGAAGIVCLKKTDFYKVGGFDEQMKIYGWEDVDFINRLQQAGLERKLISDSSLVGAYAHGDEERYDKNKLEGEIHSIFMDDKDLSVKSAVKIFIFNHNGTFKTGTIISNLLKAAEDEEFGRVYNQKQMRFRYELQERYWQTGQWKEEGDMIELLGSAVDRPCLFLRQDEVLRKKGRDEMVLFKVTNAQIWEWIIRELIVYDNRIIMLDNFDRKITAVNQERFGQATVFKNFHNETSIKVL